MHSKRLTRRAWLQAAAATAAAGWWKNYAFGSPAACADVVSTSLGKLQGECLGDVRVFRGVAFAQPPTGTRRFRAPEAPAPWQGVRAATRFAAASLQSGETGVAHSEDCLYLNLWVPAGKGPFPVFVWIHGGGFTGGHAFEPVYDGTMFAREGVICVTVGYRLGVLGFLDVEPMLGASYAGSANNGLRDVMAALAWVKEHVADFGGDPDRVTVGGESAGAKLTDTLMGVPAARPLFAQMISESGGCDRVWPQTSAQQVGAGFAEAWRDTSGQAAGALLTAPGPAILSAQERLLAGWPQHFPLRPAVDGQLIPELPLLAIAKGNSQGKGLLMGTNRDESALFVGPHPAQLTAKNLGNMPLDRFEPVFAHYAEVYPNLSQEQRRIRALTAEEYWIPTLRVVEAHTQAGGKSWMYRLDFAEARGRLAGYAFHSLDVGLVWDKPHVNIGDDEQEAALAGMMHAAWLAFIRSGSPATPALPTWPPYTPGQRATMILEDHSHVEPRPQEAERQLWDGLL